MPDQEDRDAPPADQTEPHPPPTTDTGGLESAPDPVDPPAEAVADPEPTEVAEDAPPSEPVAAPEQPVAVPAAIQYLKRWTFVLMVGSVWIVAEAIGVGLYYWWYHSLDKTPAVFVVLVFVVVCTVGGLLAAMVQNKPLISALAIALMSAPFAATAGAAVLHGLYFCDYASRCLVGLIPY
ncbi:MAG: hypothetical protein ACRDU5_01280 [Mycobacterium sp.]